MSVQDKATIKSYFVKGAKPTQQQYINLIDSYQDTGSSDAFTAIGQALVNSSTQASAQSAIGLSYVTTAQAIAGGIASGSMNPVLVKNAIESQFSTLGAFSTTAAAVSGQAATGYMNPVLTRNALENPPVGSVRFDTIATSVMATVADITSATASKLIPAAVLKSYLDTLLVTPWVAYTPTITGAGTATNISFRSRRVGSNLEIHGKFTSGIATATEARLTVGFNGTDGNVTSDSDLPSGTMPAGLMLRNVNGSFQIYALIEASVGYLTFGAQESSLNGLTKANGSAVWANGNIYGIQATIPIEGW